MFYLVIVVCGVLTNHTCAPLVAPGEPYATQQDCFANGIANKKENSDIGEYFCFKR